MNKQTAQPALKLFLLTIFALTSSCAPLTAVPSPTATPAPSQTPTATVTPSPTNTPEPIHPSGAVFYFANTAVYSVDLKNQQVKTVIQLSPLSGYFIANNSIYTILFSKTSSFYEIFKISIDGSQSEQLTTGGIIDAFNTDPGGKYLTYSNGERVLEIFDIAAQTSEVIAKPSKDSEWVWAYSWSPDRTKLFYGKFVPDFDICAPFIYDLNEKKSTAILPDKKVSCNAEWSPDGAFMAIANDAGFYLWNTKENSVRQVLLSPNYVMFDGFIWDTNGKNIFVSTSEAIYRYEVNSGKLEEISSYPDLDVPATASPDRKMILYEPINTDTTTDLYLLDLETKETVKIHSHPAILYYGKTVDTGPWDYSPAWSPDSKYFAYFTTPESTKDGAQRLFITIYEVQTGNSISFEVPPVNHAGFWKNTYWIYTTDL